MALITIPEAARRLNCNPDTLYRWIVRLKRIKSIQIGRDHLVDSDDIDALSVRPGDLKRGKPARPKTPVETA